MGSGPCNKESFENSGQVTFIGMRFHRKFRSTDALFLTLCLPKILIPFDSAELNAS